jgi:hypothetical protein
MQQQSCRRSQQSEVAPVKMEKKENQEVSLLGVSILKAFYLGIFNVLDMYKNSRSEDGFSFFAQKRSGGKIGSFDSDSGVICKISVR